jgi:hypothetical protein
MSGVPSGMSEARALSQLRGTPLHGLFVTSLRLLAPDDEWAVADRCYFSAESMQQLTTPSLRRLRRTPQRTLRETV